MVPNWREIRLVAEVERLMKLVDDLNSENERLTKQNDKLVKYCKELEQIKI